MTDKLYHHHHEDERRHSGSSPRESLTWGGAHDDHKSENPLHGADLEPSAQHRVSDMLIPPEIPDSYVHPLKREVTITKAPSQDFGTSLCLLHGDIFVTDVREHSPAWRVGLCPGDRVDAIDDVHIRPDEFHRRHVQPQKILHYLRGRPKLEIKVCDQPCTRVHTVPPVHFLGDDLGIEYQNGVIRSVAPDSTAERCGISPGESIFQVDEEIMVGKTDDEVLAYINERRITGEVTVNTIPAELALEMVWAQTMISTRDEAAHNKEKRRRDSWIRRSLCNPHPALMG